MKNILVPTDFSEYADNVYELACEIANKSRGVVTLLHVLEYPVTSIFNSTGEISMDSITDRFIIDLKRKADEELDKKLKHPSFPRVKIQKRIKIGNPYENIASQIRDIEADLVVMGTKGATGFRELLIGSNAEKVVRFSKCPVLTVHEKTPMSQINKIAYGITFSDDHNAVIMELKKYLHLFEAELHLVWINSLYDLMNEEEAIQKMEDLARLHMLQKFSVNCYRSGSADDGLLFYAAQNNIDLIAMGTHSRKGLMHLFAGSYTEDVVNHSNLPVWSFTLKQKEKANQVNEKQSQYQ